MIFNAIRIASLRLPCMAPIDEQEAERIRSEGKKVGDVHQLGISAPGMHYPKVSLEANTVFFDKDLDRIKEEQLAAIKESIEIRYKVNIRVSLVYIDASLNIPI